MLLAVIRSVVVCPFGYDSMALLVRDKSTARDDLRVNPCSVLRSNLNSSYITEKHGMFLEHLHMNQTKGVVDGYVGLSCQVR